MSSIRSGGPKITKLNVVGNWVWELGGGRGSEARKGWATPGGGSCSLPGDEDSSNRHLGKVMGCRGD
jgi:hypothetical protein